MRIRLGLLSAVVAAGAVGVLDSASEGSSRLLTSGAKLWSVRYDGPVGNGYDGGEALAPSPDGTKVFVTGHAGSGSTSDYVTIAYNAATGSKLWATRYNGPGNGIDTAESLGVSPDGTKVFVTGKSYGGSTTNYDYATVAYNASTGAELWPKRYNGPGNGSDDARSLTVSPDGTKVFVTGSILIGSVAGTDYGTVAYNAATGAKLWDKRYNGSVNNSDSAYSVAINGAGTKVFVTGYSWEGASHNDDYATVAYNASTGAKLWDNRYNSPASSTDYAYDLAISPDGTKVFVTGESYGGSTTNWDYATVAYNASTGAKAWAARFNRPANGDDTGYALAVSGDGTKVFVTGTSGGTSDSDGVTVAYNTSGGAQLWSTPYKGLGNGYDGFNALAVSGARVLVTGDTDAGVTTLVDVITAAYQA